MTRLLIEGGNKLEGKVRIAGAKNAVTKLLVASLLSEEKCTFHNVPDIGDVQVTLDLCKELGSEISWDKEKRSLSIQTKSLKTTYIPQRFSGGNRIPILMIGALLGRTKEEIIVPTMGGCNIGKRPVDFHIRALEQLGASVEYRQMKQEGAYLASAHEGLVGTHIHLPYPSVGATENAILASICAKGKTTLSNVAIEPEIIELITFLQKLGARISLDADRTIHLEESRKFYPTEHTVMPDRVEAASFAMAAVVTGGKVTLEGACHTHMIPFLDKLREVGGNFHIDNNEITCFADTPLKGGVHLQTDVFPGFLTDWQQPFVVLLSQAQGTSIIHETVYENRFGYTETLKTLGAKLELFTDCLGGKPCRYHNQNHAHSLVIQGPTPLKGGTITIPDLRAGFAYVLAALIAKGNSEIIGTSFLDRGYEHLVHKLQSLGAKIKRDQAGKELKLTKEASSIRAPLVKNTKTSTPL